MQTSARFGETQQSVSTHQRSQQLQASQSIYKQTEQFDQVAPSPTSTFTQNDCNMIVWGTWKDIYDSPVQLNFMVETPEGLPQGPQTLQSCVVEMISVQDCCVFITEDGGLYSMGQSMKGLLGLGQMTITTLSMAMKIRLPADDTKIVDIKAGSNHVLALSSEGQVFAWGLNNFGQVGTKEGNNQVWEPTQVYPSQDQLQRQDQDESAIPDFDRARQVLAYKDSSFLLTESGALYSWGKNEHNFLGRETKVDLNYAAQQARGPAVKFSNSVLTKVKKLERFRFSRIAIKDGKFMAFFVDDIADDSEPADENAPESSENTRNDKSLSQDKASSEFDSEEEKDVVAIGDLNRGNKKGHRRSKLNQSITSATSSATSASYTSGSSVSSRSRASGFKPRYSKEGSKLGKEGQRRYDVLTQTIRSACTIRDKLNKFDRMLADSMKPLLDCEFMNERGQGVYATVIDRFLDGQQGVNDAEELRLAIDKIQIQFKLSLQQLEAIERDIQSEIREALAKQAQALKDQQLFSIHDDAMFKELQVITDLLVDSLNLKKFNLVGCKMKIYQERMKELNFLELMDNLRAKRDDEEEGDNSLESLKQQQELLKSCKLLCRKTQQSLKKSAEHYLQMHLGCSLPSSLALSTMTNGVYGACDLWSGLGSLTQYTTAMQLAIAETQASNDKIRKLWTIFEQLQKTDFDKKVKKYEEKAGEYPSTNAMFEAITKEVHSEIKSVLSQVRAQMKENQRRGENQDILFFFQTLIHDAALTRQILFTTQHALFEGTNNLAHAKSPEGAGEVNLPNGFKDQSYSADQTPTPGPDKQPKRGFIAKSDSKVDDRKSMSSVKTGKSAKEGAASAKSFSIKERDSAVEATPQGGGLLTGIFGLFGSSAKK